MDELAAIRRKLHRKAPADFLTLHGWTRVRHTYLWSKQGWDLSIAAALRMELATKGAIPERGNVERHEANQIRQLLERHEANQILERASI